MNKKAVTMAFVVVLMVILLICIALLFFLNTVFQKEKEITLEEKCSVSVQQQAQLDAITRQTGAGNTVDDFVTNIKCVPVPIDMTQSNAENAAGMTALLMEKCWKTFGGATTRLFSWSGLFCNVCYAVTSDPNVPIEISKVVSAKKSWSLAGYYDVPQAVSGKFNIVLYFNKAGPQFDKKIYVRPVNDMGICQNAQFPRARLA
jgi:hypothetical protein